MKLLFSILILSIFISCINYSPVYNSENMIINEIEQTTKKDMCRCCVTRINSRGFGLDLWYILPCDSVKVGDTLAIIIKRK